MADVAVQVHRADPSKSISSSARIDFFYVALCLFRLCGFENLE